MKKGLFWAFLVLIIALIVIIGILVHLGFSFEMIIGWILFVALYASAIIYLIASIVRFILFKTEGRNKSTGSGF